MSGTFEIDLSIDWHCHLLPGLDDGPRTLDESLALARQLANAGVSTVHCTPHFIKGSYEYSPSEIHRAVHDLQSELDRHKIQLELRSGMEYLLDEFFTQQLSNPVPLGDSDLLLIEAYPTLPLEQLKEHIFTIARTGLRPLLAHPERNIQLAPREATPDGWLAQLFRSETARKPGNAIDDLLGMGCLLQGNLGSLSGFYGRKIQKVASTFYRANLYHCFGSDSHSAAQCHTTLTQLSLLKF